MNLDNFGTLSINSDPFALNSPNNLIVRMISVDFGIRVRSDNFETTIVYFGRLVPDTPGLHLFITATFTRYLPRMISDTKSPRCLRASNKGQG